MKTIRIIEVSTIISACAEIKAFATRDMNIVFEQPVGVMPLTDILGMA
jgi:predicted transcriptional regulator